MRFRAAWDRTVDLPRWIRLLIAAQPGYRCGEDMCLNAYCSKDAGLGAVRLYIRVAGKWMDASLTDICGLVAR